MNSETQDSLNTETELKGSPTKLSFVQKFDITVALNLKKRKFSFIMHNNIRNYEANLLLKDDLAVEIEPPLQPV